MSNKKTQNSLKKMIADNSSFFQSRKRRSPGGHNGNSTGASGATGARSSSVQDNGEDEYEVKCECRDHLEDHGYLSPDALCNMPCPGEPETLCGGYAARMVFSVLGEYLVMAFDLIEHHSMLA